MEKFEVDARRADPFAKGNMDLGRSIDDAQPISFSIASLLTIRGDYGGGFSRCRLSMNTTSTARSAGRMCVAPAAASTSSLGATSTLILINGGGPPISADEFEFQPT